MNNNFVNLLYKIPCCGCYARRKCSAITSDWHRFSDPHRFPGKGLTGTGTGSHFWTRQKPLPAAGFTGFLRVSGLSCDTVNEHSRLCFLLQLTTTVQCKSFISFRYFTNIIFQQKSGDNCATNTRRVYTNTRNREVNAAGVVHPPQLHKVSVSSLFNFT